MYKHQYIGVIAHDNGVLTMQVAANDTDQALARIVTAENCPTNAVKELLRLIPIEQVKKGEFFKLKATAKEVWVKQEYNRFAKRYTGSSYEDINKWKHLKKGRLVVVDFDF